MAKSVPGAGEAYLLMSVLQGDMERMNPASRRAYLEQRLRYLDEWIQILLERQRAGHSRAWLASNQREAEEAAWDEAFQLDYLIAVRQAISEALSDLWMAVDHR